MADSPGLYFVQNIGVEVLDGDSPSLYAALNVGVEALTGDSPSLYAALNVGVEALTGAEPSLYSVQNPGDYKSSDDSDTLGPEFAFAPILEELIPTFGPEGVTVVAEGIGFGDEREFVRWEGLSASGEAGPVTIGAFTQPWTAETWFRAQERGHHDTAAAIATGNLLRIQDSGATRFSIELNAGKVKIIRAGGNTVETVGAYDDGDWHHARMVQAAGTFYLLVDGLPIGSAAAADISVDRLIIGDEALKADQRMVRVKIIDMGTGVFAPEWDFSDDVNTLALYKMDELSGSTLTDSATPPNNATIGGVEDTDWRRIDWDFEVDVKLIAQIQGLDTAKVRNYELTWTVASGASSGLLTVEHTVVHAETSNELPFTVLETAPLRGTGFEVRVYDKDNFATLLDIFENAYDISFNLELSSAGAGSIKINLNDSKATAANMAHGNLVRIYLDGVERFAYRIESTKETLVKTGDESEQVVTISGRGLLSLLSDALVYPPNWPLSDPLEHSFVGSSPGEIMKTFVDAAITRGALSGVSVDFDNTDDSSGMVWASTYILEYFPGVSLTQVMQQLVGLGNDIRMTSSLVLQFYNELGIDRTSGGDPTIFSQGDNLVLHTRDGSSTDLKNTMLLLRGDILMEQNTPSTFPRRETFIDTRQTDDLTTAQELALRTLETLNEVNDSFNAQVLSEEGHAEAFIDWDLGDTVVVETQGDGRQDFRIRAITVKQTDNGRPEFICTLGNMRYEYLVRLKRMIDMFTGGSLVGSTGGGVVGLASPNMIGLYISSPTDAKYVVLESHLSLTDERVLTEGSGISITDGGAGAAVTIVHDTGDFGDVHTNYLAHGDISAAEGFLRKTGAGVYEAIKSNLSAAVDPVVTDDSASGYVIASRWMNTTDDKEFLCFDATVGAAVWVETSGGGAGGHVIEENGAPLTARANLNFGEGIIASDNDPDTDVDLAWADAADLADIAETEAAGSVVTVPFGDHIHAHGTGYLPDAHHVEFVQADADLLYDILGGLAAHVAIDDAHHGRAFGFFMG